MSKLSEKGNLYTLNFNYELKPLKKGKKATLREKATSVAVQILLCQFL